MRKFFLLKLKSRLLLSLLLPWFGVGLLAAQDPGFRIPLPVPHKYIPPTQFDLADRLLYPFQKDKIAALADDDPLLIEVYLSGNIGIQTKGFTLLEIDMIRRGEVSQRILFEAFKNPPSLGTRGGMIGWLRDSPWMDPERFLPLVRTWYQDLKRNEDPGIDRSRIVDFLTVWGHPEDEAIMNEMRAGSMIMKLFQERLQRVRHGDTKSHPNLPPIFAYRNKTLDELRAIAADTGLQLESGETVRLPAMPPRRSYKTKHVHFTVWGPGWGLYPQIKDPEQYQAFRAKAAELGFKKATINCSPENSNLPLLFKELEKLGWTPYYGYVPPHLKATHFQVRTVVTYDEADLDAAELLRIDGWGEWPICAFERRNGQRWVGVAQGVGEDTGQGWAQTHGYVDGRGNYFIHPKVRAHFEKAGLRLVYHPLEWDNPKAAQGAFWEIDTPHTMPACLSPISQDEVGMRFYEEGGNDPPELRYRRSEVAAMGSFDAAWTKEEIGVAGKPREGGHRLIVSQRFRRACLDYGLGFIRFVPVRLVD